MSQASFVVVPLNVLNNNNGDVGVIVGVGVIVVVGVIVGVCVGVSVTVGVIVVVTVGVGVTEGQGPTTVIVEPVIHPGPQPVETSYIIPLSRYHPSGFPVLAPVAFDQTNVEFDKFVPLTKIVAV